MSLYRELGRTRPAKLAAIALAGLLAGAAIGFAIGRTANEEPSLAESVQELQDTVRPALGALELVTIEYPQAVRNGRVTAGTEYAAVRSQLSTASALITANETELRLLDPSAAEALDTALRRLRQLIEQRGPAADVKRQAETSSTTLRQAARLGASQ